MKNSTVMTKANIRMLTSIPPEVSSDERAGIFGELLPEQFYTPAQESHERWTGERGLMLAVLEEAVQSYLKYRNSTTRRGRRLFNRSRRVHVLSDCKVHTPIDTLEFMRIVRSTY